MRISRLRLHDFRGWADLDLRPRTHMLLAGVPRAGRSDIIVALTRLLDPAFIRVQPTLADVRQQRASAATGDDEDATTIDNGDADDKGTGDADDKDNGATTAPDDDAPTAKAEIEVAADSQGNGYTVAAYGEVEVTLVELDPELEQLCDGFLEPLDGDGQVDETGNAVPDASLGVRLGYRVS